MHREICIWIACAMILTTGCAGGGTQLAALEGDLQIDMSLREARIRMREFAAMEARAWEAAADHVLRDAKDPAIRRNAILFKIDATGAIHSAGLRDHPLVGMGDLWVLSEQVHALLARDEDHALFSVWQPQLVQAVQATRERCVQAITRVRGKQGIAKATEFIERYARANPIRDLPITRPALGLEFSEHIAGLESASGLSSINTMSESITDISGQIRTLSDYAPKAARWQAELAMMDQMSSEPFHTMFANLSHIDQRIDKAVDVFEAAPGIVAREREAMTRMLVQQLEDIMAEVDKQRVETIEQVERAGTAAAGLVSVEREAVFDQVAVERKAMVEDAERTGMRLIDHTYERAEGLVRTIALYAAGLGLGAFALVALLLGWSRKRWPPRAAATNIDPS